MAGLKSIVPDQYTLTARYAPSLLIALPLAIAVLAIVSPKLLDWGTIWAVIVWCGGAKLLWEIGRDMGKRKEPKLFAMWGGKPSTRMLRHKNATNQITLIRQHRKLEKLMGNIRLPTPEQEKNDPQKADDIYEACSTYLRIQTRDTKKFPLIFEENCSYGFRRNLWGMKPIGILTTTIGLAIILFFVSYKLIIRSGLFPWKALFCIVINILLMLVWVFWLKADCIRIPAEAYAERLLEAIEQL